MIAGKETVRINVPSVSACAEYCGKKSFCRTAIFNSYRKTCAISYEYTLNCRYNKNRYTDFDLRHSSSHLIQIACVTKCGGDHAPSSKFIQSSLNVFGVNELDMGSALGMRSISFSYNLNQ
ncbi:unnamed protein product [Haemonchus placei]|uniref:Apple domain-containing protein n=1 Tax=Haemonchus placei TaxID=6290 RepID=A0A0N4WUT2_HAEPC|nr:unnamed protein product [Haemonchus placei]